MPILRSLAPGLLAVCETASQRAVEFVRRELQAHMFAGRSDAAAKADEIARWFADHQAF
jgi:hypothetical protein